MRNVLHHLLNRRMRFRGWIGLAVLTAALVAPTVVHSPRVSRWRSALCLERARSLVASSAFEQARIEFRSALRLQPGNAPARSELANVEGSLGHTELAYLEYESLTELHPEMAEAWVRLGELMVQSGGLEVPEELLDAAIDLDPGRGDARLLRGNIRLRLGRYYGALQDARVSVARMPDDVDARVLLVRSAARSQGADAGVANAKEAISAVGERPVLAALLRELTSDPSKADLGPAPAPPLPLRVEERTSPASLGAWTRERWPGQMAAMRRSFEDVLGRRDWPESERIVDDARRAYPGSAFPPFLDGTLELERGNLERAELGFREAMAISPRRPATLAALRRTWAMKVGPLFSAQQLLQLGTEDPGFSAARYMAARAFLEVRDPSRAEGALRAGLELQPDSPVPYRQLTNYYVALDRVADARNICRQGLERFPSDTGLQMMLAQVEVASGQKRDAAEVLARVLADRPAFDVAQYRLGLLLADETDDQSQQLFLESLGKLRADRPSDPVLLDALGWMEYRAHETGRARELLELAVKGLPDPRLHYHLAVVYAENKQMVRAREELQAALASPNAFPERVDAMRRLRQAETSSTAKGQTGLTSRPH
jgi:predicted Zn-dependent protease